LLQTIHAALRNPRWPLFFGRKAFVPGQPVWLEDGLKVGLSLKEALDPKSYSWQPRPGQTIPNRLRLVLEDPAGSDARPDQPLSFKSDARRFAPRRVKTEWLELSTTPVIQKEVEA
jgi:CRISPR system Cascade subunit CasD